MRYKVSRCLGTKPASRMIRRKVFFAGMMAGAGRGDHVLFDHDAADVVAAEAQADLAGLQPLRHPGGLHVSKVVEIDAARSRASCRYSTAVASSFTKRPSDVFSRWNVHGMKAVNPPVSS